MMGQSLSVRAFLHRQDSLDDSARWEISFKASDSYLSSCGNGVNSRRVLDVENKFFGRPNLLREDPYGYSSRVYYRSNVNVGEGVPFQWETQPGKPKTDHEHHGFNDVPLSPPPSSLSSQGLEGSLISTKLLALEQYQGAKIEW
ncbi:hypothetical protein SUGI_0246200 [Cryptomeria japonica]|nr:hypothetical protein SUGI_0246200 [Cryptomeria japonica]